MGLIQGLAEFLPISSSGHLVLFQKIFGIDEPTLTFDIVVHLGSLVAVIFVFWGDIVSILKKPLQKMTYLLIVATIPTVLAAILFKSQIESLFSGGIFLACAFAVTGVFLLFCDTVKDGWKKEKDIAFLDAIIIGCMQALAIPPGISRSGSTITGALARKLNRETAAHFSFLLSIPVIVGAALLQAKDIYTDHVTIASSDLLPMAFGFVGAALSGYLSIRFMLTLIKKVKLKYFSFYVLALSVLIFVDQFITNIFFK